MSDQSFPVVGIGASAGGLEALESFFEQVSARSNMSYVVIQHLSPDFKSLMVELLSKRSQIEVVAADDGMVIKPDTVYMIKPNAVLSVKDGELRSRAKTERDTLPIDEFFQSLAEEFGDRAVGIVLSGTGSDGTRGIRAVKEKGGFVLVQSGPSARFDGMPRSAISTGLADLILPPWEMPTHLQDYFHRSQQSSDYAEFEDRFDDLMSSLLRRTGVDFQHYKKTTIGRRVERRMHVNRCSGLEEYVKFVRKDPVEVMFLKKELLIGVTSFFRDPGAFDLLREKVIPRLVELASQERELRIWVSACSTGEEAYTLAMLFLDECERARVSNHFRIFATDVDSEAIDFAGRGSYPKSIAADLPEHFLNRFFNLEGENYVVKRHVRQKVTFAVHNIFQDPPFTRMDLVSCRNLLIYMEPLLQKKVLSLLSFALRQGGFLLLGSSESVASLSDGFESVSSKWKIYKALRRVVVGNPLMPRAISMETHATTGRNRRETTRIEQLLLDTFLPPALVVNHLREVVHVVGDVSDFVRVPSGGATSNLLKMVKEEYSLPISAALHRAFGEGGSVNFPAVTSEDCKVRVEVNPLAGRTSTRLAAIVFHKEAIETSPQAKKLHSGDRSELIVELEHDLRHTQESLQATVEELETTNEELQATNEELMSSNEQLFSANEELQSVNEELYTVNGQYQDKLEELTRVTDDLDNLLACTTGGVLFLDERLCISRYTPGLRKLINVEPRDIGRPFRDLTHNLDIEKLLDLADQVLDSGETVELETNHQDGSHYRLQIMPYRSAGGEYVRGVVLNLTEDTVSWKSSQRLQSVIDSLPQSVCVIDSTGVIVMVNDSWKKFATQNGAAGGWEEGTNYLEATKKARDGGDNAAQELLECLHKMLDDGQPFQYVYSGESPEEDRWFHLTARPIPGSSDFVISHFNITQWKVPRSKA
jgi:two-component system CheB/CheR fusion protein